MLLISLNELWINVMSVLSNIDVSPLDSKCIINTFIVVLVEIIIVVKIKLKN